MGITACTVVQAVHTGAQYDIIGRSGQNSAFWGLQIRNLKLEPFYSRKM